jgi:hydrogenase maturation protein HypF
MLQHRDIKRIAIDIFGIVQGVGFRPFVFRLAREHHLVGHIKNTGQGVAIEVQGTTCALTHFQEALITQKPSKATIINLICQEIDVKEQSIFSIDESTLVSGKNLALLPDSAICSECLQEFHNPLDRRYRYPFIHCMSCGPRFTLFEDMPFDRKTTAMKDFVMCATCQSEYENPKDRRFFSQTNCCMTCGPSLYLKDPSGRMLCEITHEAIEKAKEALCRGKIVALKNTGGFLLLASALDEEAICLLRKRKRRPKKPFALMMKDVAMIKRYTDISFAEESVLKSPQAPIVLLTKRENGEILPQSIASESPYLGVMLPHNALLMMLAEVDIPLVATSGNISDCPICIDESKAFTMLANVADLFLVHNRRITNRLDDSIVHIMDNKAIVLRRARGYVPSAMVPPFNMSQKESIFSCGAQQKSSFAFHKEGRILLSQHIGDLNTLDSCDAYDEEIEKWEHLLDLSARYASFDPHEGYYSTAYVEKKGIDKIAVQHHHAHLFSCMLDNNIFEPLLGIVWDGTGLGDDRSLWGGESFIFDGKRLKRIASLAPFTLVGGEKAMKEPKRAALSLLLSVFDDHIPEPYVAWMCSHFSLEERTLYQMAIKKGIHTHPCSSIGRLFDAISSLLQVCHIHDFEGHAAMKLEMLCYETQDISCSYPFDIRLDQGLWRICFRQMLVAIAEDLSKGSSNAMVAKKFHHTLACVIVHIAQKAQKKHVLLSGGVMQNRYLVEKVIHMLRQEGFTPHTHSLIPPNDGGVAAGQTVGALFSLQGGQYVSCSTR